MRVRASRMIVSSWPLAAVLGFGVITFLIGLKVSAQTASVLSTAVLVATLAALVWYSVETRLLRLQQQADGEMRNHPWLKGSDLKVDWDKNSGGLLGRWVVYLPITNVGRTPAHDLKIEVRWRVTGSSRREGSKEISGIDLAPHDTWHARLCEIDLDAPGEQAVIDVEFAYKSFVGGGGRLKMNFYSHEKGWANGPMSPYQFWLSDGHTFPVQVTVVSHPS